MKNIIIILICFYPLITNAQRRQRSCLDYPNAKEIYESLRQKPVDINPRDFSMKCNTTDSIKKRLLYLLIPEWNKEEINQYILNRVKERYEWYDIDNIARSVSKENDSLYKHSIDSLVNYWKDYQLNQFYEQKVFGVRASILRVVAFVNIKEAIPIIRKNFAAYNTSEAELALARLGDKKMEKKVIADNQYNYQLVFRDWELDMNAKVRKLVFVGTQESVYQISKWLDTSKYYSYTSNGGAAKSAYQVFDYLRMVIFNPDFVKMMKDIDPDGFPEWDNNLILYIKDWMKKNKGKYLLKTDFYPF